MYSLLPKPLESLAPNSPDLQEPELKSLKTLEQAGLTLAPNLIIPASLEEHFYHLNNLPHQLNKLFEKINLKRPDEDDLEDISKEAQSIIKRHYFLDEIIDMLYTTLQPMPEQVVLRRSGQEGIQTLKGRPSLIALKEVWTKSWDFEVLLGRLEKTAKIAITERPVIIQSAYGKPAEPFSRQASQILGRDVVVEATPQGITRIL